MYKVNKRIEFRDPVEIKVEENKEESMASKSKAAPKSKPVEVKPAVTTAKAPTPVPVPPAVKPETVKPVTVKSEPAIVKPEPVKTLSPSDSEEAHFDVSQHVYDGVKAAWGYGCEFTVVKPFLKMGEGIAGTVLNLTTGIDLEKGDEEIKPKLAEFDDAFINPAIARLVGALNPIVGKTDETLRPMINIMVKNLYFIPFMPKEEEKPKPANVVEQ